VADLGRLSTDKGEWLTHTETVEGKPVVELLPGIVERALAELPVPKRMRWGSGAHEFVRPVHWLLMLYGDECVEAEILGVASGRFTYGHRYHSTGAIEIGSPASYASTLESKGRVIARFADRRNRIRDLAEDCARRNRGRAVIDPELLEEVTALVEWPVPLCGTFDAHFLELPREVLVATLQGHQKYFPTEDEQGRLTDKFIAISNLESREPETVRRGNERVIRPRLADAAFFWDKDRRTRLADRAPDLAGIVFERRLGSLRDKTARVVLLAQSVAAAFAADTGEVGRAALLSRCDLVPEMVG
jgi:glycyl-tRNA synthetase beta chain